LGDFAHKHAIPVAETQAGKSALAQAHPYNFGAAGVDGAASANAALSTADLVIGIGTRLQDFTTGSRTLFADGAKLVSINTHGYDAAKHGAISLVADAKVALEALSARIGAYRAAPDTAARAAWLAAVDAQCQTPVPAGAVPTDAQVIGAVQAVATKDSIAMCAAGTMPGALKLLWQPSQGGYHMEYGYSCMGYEVAGAMGLKLAQPEREVICFVGDGSYMLANAELATAVMRRIPFTVVLTDNSGYGCINRLQQVCGGVPFNNMYVDCMIEDQPEIDYVAHAASMGAHAVKAKTLADLKSAILSARGKRKPTVIVIETTAAHGPGEGLDDAGHWWDVAVPQVHDDANAPERLRAAYENYITNAARARLVN
jgi:3D-(3,5/4)-trihydroxycyclohexane-1,2-dione acylhydrolase (decyclizing)